MARCTWLRTSVFARACVCVCVPEANVGLVKYFASAIVSIAIHECSVTLQTQDTIRKKHYALKVPS